MLWPMSFCPKTANVFTRPGAHGRLTGARRRNSGLQSTGFHQCLGLLKKHTSKIPPARPISTSICASKSTSIYTTIRATKTAMFLSSVEMPFPRPGQIQNRALPRSRQGSPKATAQRRKQSEASFKGLRQRARINNEEAIYFRIYLLVTRCFEISRMNASWSFGLINISRISPLGFRIRTIFPNILLPIRSAKNPKPKVSFRDIALTSEMSLYLTENNGSKFNSRMLNRSPDNSYTITYFPSFC